MLPVSAGRTGDSPVPSGDPPDGTKSSAGGPKRSSFASQRFSRSDRRVADRVGRVARATHAGRGHSVKSGMRGQSHFEKCDAERRAGAFDGPRSRGGARTGGPRERSSDRSVQRVPVIESPVAGRASSARTLLTSSMLTTPPLLPQLFST